MRKPSNGTKHLCCKLDLTEDYLEQSYLQGLQEMLAGAVRLLKPTTLQNAISLAHLQEIHVQESGKEFNVVDKSKGDRSH